MAADEVWRVGQIVDRRYKVAEVYDGGGMGVVYRVRHLEWDTDLAVKCPRPELFRTRSQRDRFVAEAEIWVSLGLYPNVCGCHYVRVLDGIPRVFAEFVPGGSLRDWIDDRRLYAGDRIEVLARVLDVAVQFAWGLAHAHDRGLVHQDVKPANVLLDDSAGGLVAKVTDFGLARATSQVRTGTAAPMAAARTPAGTSVAVSTSGLTVSYASPEQAAGGPVSRRADVYSFAVSVLEMFTGGIRWASGTEAGAALAARRERHEPRGAELPPDLADLLERGLRLDPAARPTSMAEIAAELIEIYRRVVGTPYPRSAPVAADLRADEFNNRGVSLLDLGRPAEAGEAFATALTIDPQHLNATYNAGLLRWRRGECTDEDLVADLDATVSSGAAPREARRLLAEVHRERGDQDQANALLDLKSTVRSGMSDGTLPIPWYDQGEPAAVYDPDFGMEVKPSKPSIRVRFTEDGTRAVTACGGVLRVWDVRDGRCLQEVAGSYNPKEESIKLGIDADGRYAITAGLYTVRFWDLSEGRCLRVFDAVFDGVRKGLDRILHWPNSVSLSGDGRVAVAAYHGGIVLVWDFPSGALRLVLRRHGNRATAAISRDGRLMLTAGCEDGGVRLREVATGRCVRVLDGCELLNDAWLSPDGKQALVAGDGEIRVWNLHEGSTRTLHGVGRLPLASASGGFVVSTDVDDTVRLWRLDDGRCLRTFRGDGSRVLAVHLDVETGVLRSAWQDNLLRRWAVPPPHTAPPRLSKPREHAELRMLDTRVAGLMDQARLATDPRTALELLTEARAVPGYEREPRLLAAWRELGRSAVRVGIRSAWSTEVFDAGAAQLALALSADGRTAVSGGVGGTVRVWKLDSGTCLRAAEDEFYGIGAVGISDDGSRVTYAAGGTIRVWSVETGERITVLDRHLALGMTAFDQAGRSAMVVRNETMRLWNLDTGTCERELPARGGLTAAYLGPDLVAFAARDLAVRLWDRRIGRHVRTLRGHTGQVMSVCLSADGRYALSAGGYTDRTIRLWDTATGECLQVFGDEPDKPKGVGPVPKTQTRRIRFSPDGRFAISGGGDATVRIWELATGRCLRALDGHDAEVQGVAISPDSRYALSASMDGTVRRWELDWDLRAP